MNIYIPFTYIIGWSEHKQFYYGCKYAQGCQPSDLWESYFTSSEYVEDFRKENGEPDIIRIHRTFSDGKECVEFEHKYLSKIDAKNNILFLNKHNGGSGFETSGKVRVLDEKNNCFMVDINDENYISGKLIHANKGQNSGTIPCYDKNGNFKRIQKELYYQQTGNMENWEWVFNTSNEGVIRKGGSIKQRPTSNSLVCIDKVGKKQRIPKTQYYSQIGEQKDLEWVMCASPEGQKRSGNDSFKNYTTKKVSCVNKKGICKLVESEIFYSQKGEKSNWEWVCVSSIEGRLRKGNFGEHFAKNTIPCINKCGEKKRITSEEYYSQFGIKKDWNWVHIRSTEGKQRKI